MNTLIYHIFHMWSSNYIYIIVIETNFTTGNLIKIFFIKQTIDQIRLPIKYNSLEHLRSFFTTTLEVYYGQEMKSC